MVEQSRDCPLCEFKATDHMKAEHQLTQSTLISCPICKTIFFLQSKLVEHLAEVHADNSDNVTEVVEDLEEINEENSDNANEVVLVKSRKLAWPAVVQKRETDVVEVKMISDDSIKVVSVDDIEDFNVEKLGNSKNTKLKNAFAKAVEILKK